VYSTFQDEYATVAGGNRAPVSVAVERPRLNVAVYVRIRESAGKAVQLPSAANDTSNVPTNAEVPGGSGGWPPGFGTGLGIVVPLGPPHDARGMTSRSTVVASMDRIVSCLQWLNVPTTVIAVKHAIRSVPTAAQRLQRSFGHPFADLGPEVGAGDRRASEVHACPDPPLAGLQGRA
jgi:hypothetical protein